MDNVLFTITKEWLQMNSTLRGGYNIKQLECLGLSYPPKKGWQSRLIGKKISERSKAMFEYYSLHGNKKIHRDGSLVMLQKIKDLEKHIAKANKDIADLNEQLYLSKS